MYSDKDLHVADLAGLKGLTVTQLLGVEDIPFAEEAWKYVCGQPLVRPEHVLLLPTQMRRLHEWYLEVVKKDRQYLMVAVRKEHYYREDSIAIEIEELFQLFNQDSLDKSLVSCYCL